MNYWLFQVSPKVMRLDDALRDEALHTFPIQQHRQRIASGDRVLLWQTGKRAGCYALATVMATDATTPHPESSTYYRTLPTAEGHYATLRIDYNLWNRPVTRDQFPQNGAFEDFYGGLPLTNYRATEAQYEAVLSRVRAQDAIEEPWEQYRTSSGKGSGAALNTILYGPPGTGKTYLTVNYTLAILEGVPLTELALERRAALRTRFEEYREAGRVAMVTFHPSYSYEDFVEGIKPSVTSQGLTYELQDGIFKQLCGAATTAYRADPDDALPYVLVIDEVNRGQTAAIFGELITLLEPDKRLGAPEHAQVQLAYSRSTLSVPPNLYLIGTMNSADRSVAAPDLALRRRFTFVHCRPEPRLLAEYATDPSPSGIDLAALLSTINHRIARLLGSEYTIGHAYLMDIDSYDALVRRFELQLIPLLQAYFFDDLAQIGQVLGRDLVRQAHDGETFYLKPASEWTIRDFMGVYGRS